jgi:hypothetical protein
MFIFEGFFLGWIFVQVNGISTFVVCVLGAALSAIDRRFGIKRVSLIQMIIRILLMLAAFLFITYQASRTYAQVWTSVSFEVPTENDMLTSENWYRIFAAPFYYKECYLCDQNCEQWWKDHYLIEASHPPMCPFTVPRDYKMELTSEYRNFGFITSIGWGFVAIVLFFGIEKGFHHLLLKIFPQG